MTRRPIITPHINSDPEVEKALAEGDYEVTADNYLSVAGYELHREEGEWEWSDASLANGQRIADGITDLVDTLHAINHNAQHHNGFCQACADAYAAINEAID